MTARDGAGRTLVLHVGMGKTGSTALQIALVRHRGDLAALGIEYPESSADAAALRGDVISGNARDLEDFLVPSIRGTSDALSKDALARVVERVAGARSPTVLYSSEFLFGFRDDRLTGLRDALARAGAGLRVVAYVRDLAGHALSTYSQVVKRSRYTADVGAFLDRTYRPMLHPRLKAAVETLGRENVHVIHYDSARRALYPGFLAAVFGLEAAEDAATRSRQLVNRSLTAHEVALMRYLNARLEDKAAASRVSDRLIELAPVDDRPLALTEAQLVWMERKFRPVVTWVNRTFFDGRSVLDVRGGAVAAPAGATDEPGVRERFLLDCIASLVR